MHLQDAVNAILDARDNNDDERQALIQWQKDNRKLSFSEIQTIQRLVADDDEYDDRRPVVAGLMRKGLRQPDEW